MSDENKHATPTKSSLKRPSISFDPKDDRKSHTASLREQRKSSAPERGAGFFQLAVPAFFGGSSKRHSGTSQLHLHGSSLNSIGHSHSFDDHSLRPGQRVRFLDRLSVRSISAINIGSNSFLSYSNDGDRERSQQLQDIQDDPNYLPGFVDLYYSTQITVTEDTCCCSIHTSYKISDSTTSKDIYAGEMEVDGMFAPCLKFFCLRRYDIMRIGFTLKIFNTTVNNTKLLTFKRKTHWFADQLDIVETYYSLENAPVGRIEKTKDGFRLINSRGMETYRIIRESKQEKAFFTLKGTLIVFCCETRKIVAKITYAKRRFVGVLCSMFLRSLKHTIRWSPEIGVAMKTLLLGVLFLELHSIEEYVDLPLGRDANTTMTSTKHRLNSII